MSKILDDARQSCPSLYRLIDAAGFAQHLEARGIACEKVTLTSLTDAALLIPGNQGGAFALPHALLVYLALTQSCLSWLPWDERRPDRVQLLQQRIEQCATQWRQLRFDARCVSDLYAWLWRVDSADDVEGGLPGEAFARLDGLLARALGALDPRGHWARAVQTADVAALQGEALLLAEVQRAQAEIGALRALAAADGQTIPSASALPPPKITSRDGLLSAAPQAVFASPDPLSDPEEIGLFLTRRDSYILWQDWKGLERFIQQSEHLFITPRGRLLWHLALASLSGPPLLSDPDAALTHTRAVLTIQPGHEGALSSCARTLGAISDWGAWFAASEALAPLLVDAQLTRDLAQSLLSDGHPDRALSLLAPLAASDPDDAATLMLLAEVYRALDRLNLAIDTLQRLKTLLPADDDPASLDDVIHVLYAELLSSPDQAIPYHRALIAQDPAHPPLSSLTALWALIPGDPDTLKSLRDHYQDTQAWTDLARLLLDAADSAQDPSLSNNFRIDAAQAFVERDDLVSAYTIYQFILSRHPNTDPGRRALAARDALLLRAQPLQAVIDILALSERDIPDANPDAWLRTRLRRASLLASLPDLPAATDLLREASQRFPDNDQVWSRLEDLLRAQHQYDDVALVLLQRLTLSPAPAQTKSLHDSLSWLLQHHTLSPDIRDTAAALIPARPSPATSSPNEPNEPNESDDDLHTADDLRTADDLSPPSLDDRPLTIPRIPIPSTPTPPIRSVDPIASLRDRVSAANDPSTQAIALCDLAQALQLRNDTSSACDALQRAASLSIPAPDRAQILCRLSSLCESIPDLDAAERHLKTALATFPARLATADLLLAFYRRHLLYPRLLKTLQFRLAKTPSSDLSIKLALLAEVANVSQTNLNDEHTALSALREMATLTLAIPSSNLPPGADPLLVHRNLATLLAHQGLTDQAILTLEALIDTPRFPLASPSDRAELFTDYAALLLSTHDHTQAQLILQRALDLLPSNPRARLLHIDLLCAQDQWDIATSHAEAALDLTPPPHLPPLLARLGKLYAHLNQRDRAQLVYQQLLSLDPQHPDALAFLTPP